MGLRKITPILGLIWESVRFFLLTALVFQVLRPTSPDPSGLGLWLFFLAAPQLIVPACFLFLALHPASEATLLNPLRVAKILAVFTALLLISSGAAFTVNPYPFRILGLAVPPVTAAFAVLVLDSLILLLLVLWKRENLPEEPVKEEPPLPPYNETEVKGIE